MSVTTAAVVLAAGRSRRMGTQKLVLPLLNKPVIAHIVDQIVAAGIESLYVVVGADRPAVVQALAGRKVHFVENPDHDGDMLSSIRCGLRALSPQCGAALIILGDQPGIHSALVTRLLRLHGDSDSGRNRGISVPIYAGKRGHPILIDAKYFPEVLSGYDGVGLQGLLDAHASEVRILEVDSAEILADMDNPGDYQRHLRTFGAQQP
jgi:molybdenum cofactor cytidylyltransferase